MWYLWGFFFFVALQFIWTNEQVCPYQEIALMCNLTKCVCISVYCTGKKCPVDWKCCVSHTLLLPCRVKLTWGGVRQKWGCLPHHQACKTINIRIFALLNILKIPSKAGRKQNLSALFLERKGRYDMVKDLSLPIPARLPKQDLE